MLGKKSAQAKNSLGEVPKEKCAWEIKCLGKKVPRQKNPGGSARGNCSGKKVPGEKSAPAKKCPGKKMPGESAQGKKCLGEFSGGVP